MPNYANQTSPPCPLYRNLTGSCATLKTLQLNSRSIGTRNRNAGAQGNAKFFFYRNEGTWNAKEKSRKAGTQNTKAYRNAYPSLEAANIGQWWRKLSVMSAEAAVPALCEGGGGC